MLEDGVIFPVENSTHCEMLLGFVVLVEVDAGSVVVLHGVAGQQLSEKEKSSHSVHVPGLFYSPNLKIEAKFSPTHSCNATSRGRPLPRLIYRFLSTEAATIPKCHKNTETYLTKLSTCDMDAS